MFIYIMLARVFTQIIWFVCDVVFDIVDVRLIHLHKVIAFVTITNEINYQFIGVCKIVTKSFVNQSFYLHQINRVHTNTECVIRIRTLPHVISLRNRSRATALKIAGAVSAVCKSLLDGRVICLVTFVYSVGCIRSNSSPTLVFFRKQNEEKKNSLLQVHFGFQTSFELIRVSFYIFLNDYRSMLCSCWSN